MESEGPAALHIALLTVGPSAKRRAWQRENAGCWPLHLAYMYVLCQRAFCIRAVATSSPSSFSLSASFPAGRSFHPPFLRDVHRASFLLIKSRPPRLPPFVFSIFSLVPPAPRESRAVSTNSEKRTLAPKKGHPQGGKRVTI